MRCTTTRSASWSCASIGEGLIRATAVASINLHDREDFLGKIERGSESVQWGKLFQVLDGLGIRVVVDIPESVVTYLNAFANSKGEP